MLQTRVPDVHVIMLDMWPLVGVAQGGLCEPVTVFICWRLSLCRAGAFRFTGLSLIHHAFIAVNYMSI